MSFFGIITYTYDSQDKSETIEGENADEVLRLAKVRCASITGNNSYYKNFKLKIGEATETYDLKREWNVYPTGQTKTDIKAKETTLEF